MSEHENMSIIYYSTAAALLETNMQTPQKAGALETRRDWRPLSVTLWNCNTGRTKRVASSHPQGCAEILKATASLPEEIFKARQLVAW